ncbi:MAG: hypothetical protein MRY74_05645 [Neomegalonema sp.]|nr:hypothetical protein [Neomegalonema sp.]
MRRNAQGGRGAEIQFGSWRALQNNPQPHRESCSCGASAGGIYWNERSRRAAGVALAACHYRDRAEAADQFVQIIGCVSVCCEGPLATRLLRWASAGCGAACQLKLAEELVKDADLLMS